MCLVSHSQAVGVRSTTGPHGTSVAPVRDPAGPGERHARVVAGIRFSGFTVTHAQGEGILAAGLGRGLTGISIRHSAVVHNDLGFGVPNTPYFQCQAMDGPGDCGEGVHFTGVADSKIKGNFSPSTPAGCC